MFAITSQLLNQKNKTRQGYKKVMDTLYTCVTPEQYETWMSMAQVYMDMVCFHLDKYEHYTRLALWERKQYNKWFEEVTWIGEDIINKGQEYYSNTFKQETTEEQKKEQKPVVVRGFCEPDKKKRKYVKRKQKQSTDMGTSNNNSDTCTSPNRIAAISQTS